MSFEKGYPRLNEMIRKSKMIRFETSTNSSFVDDDLNEDTILNSTSVDSSNTFSSETTHLQEEKLNKLESQINKLINMKALIHDEIKKENEQYQ